MESKDLTSDQVQVLILAMLGVKPDLTDVKPYEYDVLVKQLGVETIQKANMLGLEINLRLYWFSKLAHHPIEEEYQLFIAYLDTIQQINPAFIKLVRTEGDETGVIPLGNLIFITDKLREYSVW